MSIYQESRVDLVGLVSLTVGITYSVTDLQFGTPKAPAVGETVKNTKVGWRLVPSAPQKGQGSLFYDRLDLGHLGTYPPPDFPPNSPPGTSVYDMFSAIQASNGITFTADDLEETFVTVDGHQYSVLLKAKPTSLGWFGQHLLILRAPPQLSTAFTSNRIFWS